jgi:hypothetical protein
MTDKQPTAYEVPFVELLESVPNNSRLWVDFLEGMGSRHFPVGHYCHKAAAELRRLHQSEREAWRYAAELEQDRKRLHEVNAKLVEALRLMNIECQHLHHAKKDQHGYDVACPVVERIKASIAKATGEQQ